MLVCLFHVEVEKQRGCRTGCLCPYIFLKSHYNSKCGGGGVGILQTKGQQINFCDLEFDMLFTVRTPYWEVLGGFPKRQKYGCFLRTLPRGVQRCTYGPKVGKRVENGSPKGLQNGAKIDKKGSQKHALIPMTPFGRP